MRLAGRPGCRREVGSGAGSASSNANPKPIQNEREYSAVLMPAGHCLWHLKTLARAKHKKSEKP